MYLFNKLSRLNQIRLLLSLFIIQPIFENFPITNYPYALTLISMGVLTLIVLWSEETAKRFRSKKFVQSLRICLTIFAGYLFINSLVSINWEHFSFLANSINITKVAISLLVTFSLWSIPINDLILKDEAIQ